MILTGRMVLAGKGGRCLAEGSDHIIGKIFKVHGNGTACNCRRVKTIHRGLYKNIGKAENSTLNGRGDSDFKNRHHRSVKSDLKLEQEFDKIKVKRD